VTWTQTPRSVQIMRRFVACVFRLISPMMEWTKQLLSKSSTRGIKQLNVSSSPVTCGSNVDDFSAHKPYHNDIISVCQAGIVTSSPPLDSYRTIGNCNGTTSAVTSSCAVEHRMTGAQSGAPMRTVSISRSGRYKSKSKQRARLLSADVDQLTAETAASISSQNEIAHRQYSDEPIGSAAWNPKSPPVTSPPAEAARSTALGAPDDPRRSRTFATSNAAEGVTQIQHMDASSPTTSHSNDSTLTASPIRSAMNVAVDDVTPRLEVAFESTDL
jgi:hypothetical protein